MSEEVWSSEDSLIRLVDRPILVFGRGNELLLANSKALTFVERRVGSELAVGSILKGDEIRRIHPDLVDAIAEALEGREVVLVDSSSNLATQFELRPIYRGDEIYAVAVKLDGLRSKPETENHRSGLSLALDRIASGVTVASPVPDYGLTEVNQAFCDMTGYSRDELLGRNTRFLQDDLDQGEALDTLRKALARKERTVVVLKNRRKNGDVFLNRLEVFPVFDDEGELVEFLGVQNDITKDVELAEAVQNARRLESLGRMSTGLAHDFNNDLSVILQSVEIALEEVSEAHPVHEDLQLIREAARHASRLTRRLLDLGTNGERVVEIQDVAELVGDIEQLLNAMVRPRGDLIVQIDSTDSLCAYIDRLELERVVLNLVANAADAIEPGGRVAVTLGARDGWIVLRVEDDGRGMDSSILRMIFQPYFTTKGPAGTGLGLVSSKRIIEGYGGTISVESEPGVGSTFEIEIPMTFDSDSYAELVDPLDD